MLITTKAIVLKENTTGNDSKYLSLLTKDYGKITAFLNNNKRLRTKFSSSTDLFCYSTFVLFKSKDKYYVNSADIENVFFNIRTDIEKLSLSSYLSELSLDLAPIEEDATDYLRLILNSLYMIDKNQIPLSQIKSIFELRILSLSGYMPDIVACIGCGVYEKDLMYFRQNTGELYCNDCMQGVSDIVPINKSIVTAMRHIIYSDYKKIFSFSLSENNLKLLNIVVENYMHYQLEHSFKTLEFYKTLFFT